MADKDDLEKTIAEDLVVTKYKMAAEITNSKGLLKLELKYGGDVDRNGNCWQYGYVLKHVV